MPESRIYLGKASFSQPKFRTRVYAQASVDVSTEAPGMNGTDFPLSSFIDSVPWTKAKHCFAINFVVSFGDDSSFSPNSRRALLKQLGKTLRGAELWSQLQLSADVDVSCDDLETKVQTPATLRLDIHQQHPTHNHQPERVGNRSNSLYDVGNMKPPSGVQTIFLCMVNISLVFSCPRPTALVPQKRPHSESEGFLDLIDDPMTPSGGMLRLMDRGQGRSGDEQQEGPVSQILSSKEANLTLNDFNLAVSLLTSNAGSEGMLASALEEVSDDTESLVFSSQGSTIFQSQDASIGKACDFNPSPHIPSMVVLTDAAIRNLICRKPIRTAPGIRTDTSKLEARLSDIAPLTFSPGYAENVAARATLVPTIARFLTSFLQKARSTPVTAKKDVLIREFSNLQRADHLDRPELQCDEETKLKEAVKTCLWKTMANGLQNPEPARRLKPLLATDRVRQDEMLDTENNDGDLCEFPDALHHETLWEDPGARPAPISSDFDDEDQLLDLYEDDDADGYELDLFDIYEERLGGKIERRGAGDFEYVQNDNDHSVKERTALHDPVDALLFSPKLQLQEDSPDPKSARQAVGTSAANEPTSSTTHAATLADLTASTTIGPDEDDDWPDLLDEQCHPESRAHTEDKHTCQQRPPIEDDWEPGFEQWEFDVEQGYDEMLL